MNLKTLKNLDRDDVLNLLGLESKSSTAGWMAGTLGTFGIGLLVGASLGLILAPKPGREFRSDIRNKLRHAAEDQVDTPHEVPVRDPNSVGVPCVSKTA